MYSYFLASMLASGSQFLKIVVTLVRPAKQWNEIHSLKLITTEVPECTQTGWWDFLKGNFQSEISFESHRPQQAFTTIVSLHEYPFASDSVCENNKLVKILILKWFWVLTSNSIGVNSFVTPNRSFSGSFYCCSNFSSETESDEKWDQKQKLWGTKQIVKLNKKFQEKNLSSYTFFPIFFLWNKKEWKPVLST